MCHFNQKPVKGATNFLKQADRVPSGDVMFIYDDPIPFMEGSPSPEDVMERLDKLFKEFRQLYPDGLE